MEDVLKIVWDIRSDCKNHTLWLQQASAKIEDCFGMIHNSVTMTYELLHYYSKIWEKSVASTKELEHIRKENGERVMEITKWAFISNLSSVEYIMKKTLGESIKGPITSWFSNKIKSGKRVYLRNIIDQSRKKGVIDNVQYASWTGMIELRNAIVHNNAIADKNLTLNIEGTILVMKTGSMTRGNLMTFPTIIKSLAGLTRNWFELYLKSHTI